MPFTQAVMPQFRDADEDGLIGIRGCMRCFQDIHTWYMHSMDKGNDVLPEQYGAAWIYTRYQIRLHRKMDYSGPMTLSTWIEPGRQQARVTLNVTIRQGGDLTAEGRLESCIYSLTQRRPLRLSAVEFPENLAEDLPHEIPAFRKLGKDMILAVNQRAASDDRTLGELFWLMTAEAAEISFTKTLALILEALLDTVREFFAVSDEQMQAFTHCFLAKLPQHLRSALGIPHPSVAA